MRNQDEIVNRVKEVSKSDLFGVMTSDLLAYLDFEHAKEFLKEGTTKEEWEAGDDPYPKKEENIKEEIVNYMPFAFGKANDCRGLSATRSINHMQAWLWLLGDAEYEKIEAIPYQHYGKEKLIAICEMLGLDWKQWDNGARTNGEE